MAPLPRASLGDVISPQEAAGAPEDVVCRVRFARVSCPRLRFEEDDTSGVEMKTLPVNS